MSSDLPTPQNPDIHGKRPKSDREATLRNPLAEHRVRSTTGPSKYFHTRPNTLLNVPLALGRLGNPFIHGGFALKLGDY
jgi:hypothetical protein